MKKKKFISFLIILLFGIWFLQYFISYVPGAYTIGVLIIGVGLWIALFGIFIYQIIKYAIEVPKQNERLIFITLILVLNLVSFANPFGIVDWEKHEGKNILVAEMVGTANCRTIITLKNNNRLKYTSRCFGEDFYFGTYTIKNDTLYLDLEENVGFMDKSSYAILIKSQTDTSSRHSPPPKPGNNIFLRRARVS